MKQPTLNGKPIGRYQKIQLYQIIINQEIKIQNLLYLLGNCNRVNKKNLEYFKRIVRSLETAEIKELDDK